MLICFLLTIREWNISPLFQVNRREILFLIFQSDSKVRISFHQSGKHLCFKIFMNLNNCIYNSTYEEFGLYYTGPHIKYWFIFIIIYIKRGLARSVSNYYWLQEHGAKRSNIDKILAGNNPSVLSNFRQNKFITTETFLTAILQAFLSGYGTILTKLLTHNSLYLLY